MEIWPPLSSGPTWVGGQMACGIGGEVEESAVYKGESSGGRLSSHLHTEASQFSIATVSAPWRVFFASWHSYSITHYRPLPGVAGHLDNRPVREVSFTLYFVYKSHTDHTRCLSTPSSPPPLRPSPSLRP